MTTASEPLSVSAASQPQRGSDNTLAAGKTARMTHPEHDDKLLRCAAYQKNGRRIAMPEIKLRPCPFCGGVKLKLVKKKIKYKGKKAYVASIRCNCCNARGGTVINITIPYAVKEDVEREAVDRWNRREQKVMKTR